MKRVLSRKFTDLCNHKKGDIMDINEKVAVVLVFTIVLGAFVVLLGMVL